MKRSFIFALLIPAMFVLAWWAGYNFYGAGNDGPKAPTDTQVSVQPRGDSAGEASGTQTPIQAPNVAGSDNLAYLGWAVDDAADEPRICFNFYTPLDTNDQVKIRDYIRVDPKTSVAANIAGNDLCLTGFAFDEDYKVTLLEGLSDASGKVLNRDIEENISFGDKPPYVAFAGQGIILPRVNAQGLAIETINVDAVNVEIARVNDRIIARRTPQEGKATLEGDYGWEYEDAATSVRDVIWDGEIAIKKVRNEKITTVLPLSKITGELAPGAYVVTAIRKHEDNESEVAKAWRWIISTDLALTSYQGDDGLTLGVRSIDTAKLQPNIDVTLVADNNDILAKAKTDASGHVTFAAPLLNGKGSKRARMVMAYGPGNDYAVLDLDRAALDLSEYDISGRRTASGADVYGFSERGVYRPGETAHLTVMLRDNRAKAMTDRPVSLVVRRPNGIEMFTHPVPAAEIAAHDGTITWGYDIPESAPRGVWSVGVDVEGSGESGRVEFSVEDFVPQKLKLAIDVDEAPIRADELRKVSLDAQFLYGAPGAALEAEAEARLRLDPSPFPQFKDYAFGPAKRSFNERYIDMGNGLTDGAGKIDLALNIKSQNLSSPFPLRAEITAGVAEPGGRYVRDSVRVAVRTQDTYLGVDPLYDGSRAPRGKATELALIAVDRMGKQKAANITWTLVEEDWSYQWYRENGNWRYRRDVRDIPLTTGTLDLAADGPTTWIKQLTWGDYRLDIAAKDGTVAGHRFGVGWGQAETSDSPDQLRIGTNADVVKAGDTLKLSINAPYAGEGELVIANEAVRLIKPLKLSEGASELSFTFAPEWGDSVYAMMTLYTPRDPSARPVPRRAVGISYIALDRSVQTLTLDIDAPEVLRPRTDHTFTVDVKGAPRGEDVWMNFAAVDEGILQITKYTSPDASGFFFGKKALGVDIRDDYGRMLNANLGAPIKFGGDSLGGEGLTVVPTKTVALFSGPVKVKGGKAKVKFDLPDFNGELRLMATAWSGSAVGSASSAVKLRDKVPAIVGLPRFLAPGDTAMATVSLDNVEGEAGTYEAALEASDVVTSEGRLSMDLATGQRLDERLDISADALGVDTLLLKVTGPGGYKVTSAYPVQVRTPFMPVTTAEYKSLEPGETFSIGPDMIAGYEPGSTDISVSFSRLPGLDPAPYVSSLARYPYGCTEQTVSTAMPLLYAKDLGGIPGQSEQERRRGIQKAVARLSSRQSLDGAFGLWSSGDRYASPWLGVYVTDFMYRAKSEGLHVSNDVLARAKSAISETSRMPRYPNLQYRFPDNRTYREQVNAEAAAYAHFVLAREGAGNLGQMRYLYDNHKAKIKTPLAHAYMGGALAMMGDKGRSKSAFANAVAALGYNDDKDYYQSSVRDVAGVIAAVVDAGRDDLSVGLAEDFRNEIMDETYLNTQEKAHVILALRALMKTTDAPSVSAKGVKLAGEDTRPIAALYGTDLDKTPTFTSKDKSRIWATVTVSGAPQDAPLPMSEGFTLNKRVFTMGGKPAVLDAAKQGDRFIVRLQFASTINQSRTMVMADLLPAGFEIETILRPEDGALQNGQKGAYDWLGKLSKFQVTEARDDRFVASLETYRKDDYAAAYIVRAVTPGDFVLPGAVVEDMYRPQDRAITETTRIRIAADPAL